MQRSGDVESCYDNCLAVSNSPRIGVCGYESEHHWNDSDDDFVDLDWQDKGEPQGDNTPYDTSSDNSW